MNYCGLHLWIREENGVEFVDVRDANFFLFESMAVPTGADALAFAQGEIDAFFTGAHSI